MTTGMIMLLAGLVIVIIYYVQLINTEIRLRNLVLAQQKVCQADFDKMWKVIKQITHVSDKYIDTFKEIYPKLIEGRYQQNSKALAKFIGEMNPEFDTSLMAQLNNAIEANREMFFAHQQLLIAQNNEHTTFIQSFPACILLPAAAPVEITVITSDYTQEVYRSGRENL